jgi:hypothetical protein
VTERALEVVESLTVPRTPACPNADRLIISDFGVGVVDGSTPKPWNSDQVADGVAVAVAVARALGSLSSRTTSSEALAAATTRVAGLPGMRETPRPQRPCATFAILAVAARQVWRVGDQWIMVDRELLAPPTTEEAQVARIRAGHLREALAAGRSVDGLRAADEGRKAIMPRLEALAASRNATDHYGYGAIDGGEVPERYLEVVDLPSTACEVVLATDGYPSVASTVSTTERALGERISRDPLMTEEPPQTKCVEPGANSFDDRTYVRVRLRSLEAM